MSIKVSSRKGKARELQNWVCEKISQLTGIPWGKDEEIASREMGQSGCDVRMSHRVRSLVPFTIECKRQESWSIPAWIRQAKSNVKEKTDWLLVIRKNHDHPIIVMDANAFFKLLRKCTPQNKQK